MTGTGFYGGDWGSDNTIAFVPDVNGGLWSVSANGGTPQPLLKTDVDKDLASFCDPQILPAAKGILLTLTSSHAFTVDDLDVAVLAPVRQHTQDSDQGGQQRALRWLPDKSFTSATARCLLSGSIWPRWQ